MGFSDICSPLTEVEPDYSTDNTEHDDDEAEDSDNEDGMRGARDGHEDSGNIYEQVLNCRRPSLPLQLPPLPLPPIASQGQLRSSPSKQELGHSHMWAQGRQVVNEEEEDKTSLRWKARQLKESLSAKFSVRLLQIRN